MVVDPSAYQRWRSRPLGRVTEELELRLVFQRLGELRGQRVLDVGTGDGTYAIEAARRGAEVVGLDAAHPMLEAASSRATKAGVEVDWVDGRAEVLLFPDDSFDVVLMVTVLCLLSEPQRALRELSRVVRPGGVVVVGELGRWSTWALSRRIKGWMGSPTWRHARFWSGAELEREARSLGLVDAESRGAIFYPPCGACAQLMAGADPWLTRLDCPGAAFVVVLARSPAVTPVPATLSSMQRSES